MNHNRIAAYFNNVIFGVIFLVAVLTPLIFLNITSEFYEIPKLAFLFAATLVLLLLWAGYWIISGKVQFTRTPLDLPLLLLLIIVMISTFFSSSFYVSIFGNFPRIHGSAISWAVYIIFFFILASNIRKFYQVKYLIYGLIISATTVAIITLLSYAGVFLPLKFAQITAFTPTGSPFSTGALLTLLLPILLVSIINPNKFIPQLYALAIACLFALVIAFTASIGVITASLVGMSLVILSSTRSMVRKHLPLLLVPFGLAVFLTLLSYIPFGRIDNPFEQYRKNYQPFKELQLPFVTSWKVSAKAFADAPFVGTGPSTFLFNFSNYRPAEFNNSKGWNFRFDQSFNEYFQIFGTLGILGLIAFIFFTIMVFVMSWIGIAKKNLKEEGNDYGLTLALSVSSICALILFAFHVTSLTSILISLIIFALLMTLHKVVTGKVEDLTLGIRTTRNSGVNELSGDILPIIFMIPILLLVIVGFWYAVRFIKADFTHRRALTLADKDARQTYQLLVDARNGNPWIDAYRKDLATATFAIANAIARQKGPSEASPAGSLTDQDKRDIQTLLSQSITEARSAVALSPRSAENWEILGSIYRQITGVAQNALQFSLASYSKAVALDPYNPLLRLNVGGIYYAVKNYDLAVRFFTDSVNLKPDFTNGYYNLAIALRDKGDLKSAQLAGEQVVKLLSYKKDDPNYKVATDFLADLNARIATGSADQSKTIPPAAAQTSILQNQNLPQLEVDLQNKQEFATPEAAPSNPGVRLPASTGRQQ